MESGIPVLSAYGNALATVAYAALAVRAAPRRSVRGSFLAAAPWAFFAAALASAVWAVAGWLPAALKLSAGRLQDATDLIRYGAWFAFLLLLMRPHSRAGQRRGLRWYGAAALLLLAAAATGRVFAGAFGRDTFYLLDSLGRFASLALAVFGLVLTEQVFRNATDESRWGVKPLCFGLSCIFAFDLYLYSQASLFGEVDSDASSIRGVVHALAVPLIFVASQRNSDWLARLQLSRAVAFHSVALLLAGAYLLFISALGYYVRYFGGSWGGALQLGTLVAALVALAVTLSSGAMRAKLRVWLGKHFFSYRYDYRREWLRFTQTLSAASSPQHTGRLVIRGLADMLESPAGGLWSMAPGDTELVQVSRWNVPAIDGREPPDSPFAAFLLRRGWIVDLDEYRRHPDRYDGVPVPPWLLDQPQFWLVVPLIVADSLTGFVVLARARTPIDVNWEVTDLLKTASRQAASFLAQVNATEALLEVRKFDAFNRMSAFVVHDLKNIVTQLSLMMKNAERLRDNPEFQDDMMMTIDSSLEKMRRMMLQLREGQAPADGASGVALAPILRRLEAQAQARGQVLDVTLADRSATTRGDAERVERVLGHVVQNAFDATPPGGRVWVRLERTAGQATVEVGDSGCGMSAEFMEQRLFKPFQTTKAAGMGIGAYESFQYIKELGGSIGVASEVDRGTVVTLSMPLLDTRAAPDRQLADEPT